MRLDKNDRTPLTSTRLTAGLIPVLLATLGAGSAGAQEPGAGAPPAPESPVPAAAPAPEARVPAATPTPASPTATEEKDFGIERLTPFPAEYNRGMEGGSLWLMFHGLQWPYYPRSGIAASGYVWLDTGYRALSMGDAGLGAKNRKEWLQQGRAVLRVTPTYTFGDDYFVQGQVELVGNKDQTQAAPQVTSTDDVWVRFGQWNKWDVQVGRFQTWEIAHVGMGLDLFTLERKGAEDANIQNPPPAYLTSYVWDRVNGPGRLAAHAYPNKWLRFELAADVGNEGNGGSNTLAARPAAIVDLGKLKLKGAFEYKQLTNPNGGPYKELRRGGGGGLLVLPKPWIELGLNAGYGIVDVTTPAGVPDGANSTSTLTVGGFASVMPVKDLILGGGAQLTWLEDLQWDATYTRHGIYRHYQAYGAAQYLVMRRLYVKAVYGWAQARVEPSNVLPSDPGGFRTNEMWSVRLRLMYLF